MPKQFHATVYAVQTEITNGQICGAGNRFRRSSEPIPPESRIRPSAVAWRTASVRCFVASSCVSRGSRAPQVYTTATRRHGVVLLTVDTTRRERMARNALRDVRDKKTRAAALPGTSAAHASRGRRRVANGVRVIDCSNNPLRSSRRRMQGPRRRGLGNITLCPRGHENRAQGEWGHIEVWRCTAVVVYSSFFIYLFFFSFHPRRFEINEGTRVARRHADSPTAVAVCKRGTDAARRRGSTTDNDEISRVCAHTYNNNNNNDNIVCGCSTRRKHQRQQRL